MKAPAPEQHHIQLPEGFLTPAAEALFTCLNKNGAESLFVGGCVRDAVLGIPAADLDLATTLTPGEATKVLTAAGFKVEPTGLEHGTVMAIKGGESFEVTALRRDVRTDGRHAEVEFTTDFAADAARRDFTFNAMYMDASGTVSDWFGGIADLKAGKVRFVGKPDQRLREDWLRALRYMRFYGRFGAKAPDSETKKALKTAARHLKDLSKERKTTEFLKTLQTEDATQALLLMEELGYMKALALKGFCVASFQAFKATWPDVHDPLELLIAGLWSPRCPQRLEQTLLNNNHFRFSKVEKSAIRHSHPARTQFLRCENIPHSCWQLGPQSAARLWRLMAAKLPETSAARKDAVEAATKAADFSPPPCPVDGEDVMALRVKKGPALGHYLSQTQDWWARNSMPDKAACIAWLEQTLKNPPHILVVPDLHGELNAFKKLIEGPYGQRAEKIILLGDYLDANKNSENSTDILTLAGYIADLMKTDPRFVLIRANHEQINVNLFRRCLRENKTLADIITPNKHREELMRELGGLPKAEQMAQMADIVALYDYSTTEGATLTLKDGHIIAFTHGGWHLSFTAPHSAVAPKSHVAESTLTRHHLRAECMPEKAKHEAMWGHHLNAPPEAHSPQTEPLHQPPAGVTLIVGHHYSRIKNPVPVKAENIIFADCGAGKGGSLAALWLNARTGEAQSLLPEKDGRKKAALETRDKLTPFPRSGPKPHLFGEDG